MVFSRLRRARRGFLFRRTLEAVASWLGTCAPGLAVLFLLALPLPPSRLASGVAAAAAIAWVAATAAVKLLLPLARPMPLAAYAAWLERKAHLSRNELSNALALERDRTKWTGDRVSRDLVELCVERATEVLQQLPLRDLHPQRSLRAPLTRVLASLTPLLALWLIAPPKFSDTARTFLLAGSSRVLPVLELRVEPGSLRVAHDAAVTIRAQVAGRRLPPEVTIDLRSPQGRWMTAQMTREDMPPGAGADRYSFQVTALKDDLDYRVRARWAQSPVYRLAVIEGLQATGYRKVYEPPAYTGLQLQREASATGDLTGVAGTQVTLEVLYRRPGITGRIVFESGAGPLELERQPDRLQATWMLETADRYQVELRDDASGERWISDPFPIDVVPDLEPRVRLLQPPPLIVMPPDMHVLLEADAVDDFGLTELALVYEHAGGEPNRTTLARWKPVPGEKETRLQFDWDLTEIGLLPDQEIHYYLQALDNDPRRGPKSGETGLCVIRFPAIAEMYAQAETERRGDIQSMEEALRDQTALRDELQTIAREMLRENQVSWEKQQEIQDLVSRQEDLGHKIEQLQQSLEASRQRMENQNLFSMEVLEKVRQVQDLVAQVQSEEFLQGLERMRQALAQLDRQAMRQAMAQMKVTQEEVSQALDRTLQMLRRLLAEEQIDRLAQKLAELEARQAEINKQLEMGLSPQPRPGEESSADSLQQAGDEHPLSPEEEAALKAEQEALAKELEALRQELAKLAEQEAQQVPDLKKALEEFLKNSTSQEALEQMRQAQAAMEQGQRRSSLKFGRKARSSLQQMQAGLAQMRQGVDIEKMEALARALYDISHRMVAVSMRQEELVAGGEERGPRELAVLEQEFYEEMAAAGDSLLGVARETPSIGQSQLRAVGKALRGIADSRDAFEGGRRQAGLAQAGESMRAINAAVKQLLEAASQAQASCPSGCPSPFNKMQCMSGQQGELNQDTQQTLAACQTPRLTQSQEDALLRLAARQEMIRQGLDEVRGELDGTGKVLGDLGSIAKEMEEVARELKARRADPRIVKRQEKILSRLLTAQRSIRRQDENEERQSRTGQNPQWRAAPPEVEVGRPPVELLQRAMLRGSQDPVPAEYRRLVDLYMRSLLRSP